MHTAAQHRPTVLRLFAKQPQQLCAEFISQLPQCRFGKAALLYDPAQGVKAEEWRANWNRSVVGKTAEATAQTFLGVRLNCAKCHNHPFEKWQQKDYFSLAAFLLAKASAASMK